MSKLDRIHNVISKIYVALYIAFTICLLVFTFLPFKEDLNYYEACGAFYKGTLWHPVAALLLAICPLAMMPLFRKHPIFVTISTQLCSTLFHFYISMPKALTAVSFALTMQTKEAFLVLFGVGEMLLSNVSSYMHYAVGAFFIYGIVIFFCRSLNRKKVKNNETEEKHSDSADSVLES